MVGRERFRPALQEKPKLPRKVRAGPRDKIPWNLEGQFVWLEIVFLKRSIGDSKHSEMIWNYNWSKNLGLHKMIHLFWCFSCLVNVDFGKFDQPSKVREARRESRRVLVSHWCSRGGCTVWSTKKQQWNEHINGTLPTSNKENDIHMCNISLSFCWDYFSMIQVNP